MLKNIPVESAIQGIKLFEPKVFVDSRGEFLETYRASCLREAGIEETFVQENQSKSFLGVLRGMHYQHNNPQAKLLRVIRGCIYDVVIDLRAHSPTCLKWFGVILSDLNRYSFFIPKGFAHGFLTLSDEAIVEYKCSDYYNVGAESGVRWDDPKIGIDWHLEMYGITPNLSHKDSAWPLL